MADALNAKQSGEIESIGSCLESRFEPQHTPIRKLFLVDGMVNTVCGILRGNDGPTAVLVQREWHKQLCMLSESKQNNDCEWSYRSGANPGPGDRAASCRPSDLGPGRRSGRVPTLRYPPPRLLECTSQHCGWSTSFSLILACRLASAAASFCHRAAQIASARPVNLSGTVM
jgi:hypothetical protein